MHEYTDAALNPTGQIPTVLKFSKIFQYFT